MLANSDRIWLPWSAASVEALALATGSGTMCAVSSKHHITVLVAVASHASVATNLDVWKAEALCRRPVFRTRLEGSCSSLALDLVRYRSD